MELRLLLLILLTLWMARLSMSHQLGCDLLFAQSASDNLAAYCQCKDWMGGIDDDIEAGKQDPANNPTPIINQLDCSSQNLSQILQDLDKVLRQVDSTTASKLAIGYLYIQTNLSAPGYKLAPELDHAKLLQVDHLSIQLNSDERATQAASWLEEQMIDLIERVINTSRLQFMSISLLGGQVRRSREDKMINLEILLKELPILSRLELSVAGDSGFIIQLDGNSLRQQTRLKWLNLAANNGIKLVSSPEANNWPFSHSKGLEYLSLESCNLDRFPLVSMFGPAGLANLTSLNLASNRLLSLDSDLFGWSDEDLSANKQALQRQLNNVAQQDDSLCETGPLLASLNQLDLSYNKITELSLKAGQCLLILMPNLNQIYLQHNRIAQVNLNSLFWAPLNPRWPHSVFNGGDRLSQFVSSSREQRVTSSKLEYLDLSHNRLTKITGIQVAANSTSGKVRLKSINLSHNALRSNFLQLLDTRLLDRLIFEESFAPSKTSRLSMKQLDIRQLDSKFSLPYTTSNSSSLPTTLCDFLSPRAGSAKTNLLEDGELINEIQLHNNKLEVLLERDFKSPQCSEIQFLQLSANRISRVEPNALNSLIQLEMLDLSKNQIEHIEVGLFMKNVRLKVIRLSFNKISTLMRDTLSKLIDLEELFLDNNQISGHLSDNLFASNTHLTVIDLSSNRISHLSSNMFANLQQLKVLHLHNNILSKFSHQLFAITKLPASLVVNLESKSQQLGSGNHRISQVNKIKNINDSGHNKPPRAKKPVAKHRQSRQADDSINDDANALDLASNQLDTFVFNLSDCGPFAGEVQSLVLNGNKLSELSQVSFRCFRSLKRLHLRANHIKSVDALTFETLDQLEIIDLSQNLISKLKPGTLASTKLPLDFVNLSSNDLLDVSALQAFKVVDKNEFVEVNHLSINDNPYLTLELLELSRFLAKTGCKLLEASGINQIFSIGSGKPPDQVQQLTSVTLSSVKLIDEVAYKFLLANTSSFSKINLSFSNAALKSNSTLALVLISHLNSNLMELNLAGNRLRNDHLKFLATNLTDSIQLNKLNLSLNQLEYWPLEEGSKFNHLESLDLSRNRLRSFIKNDHLGYKLLGLRNLNLSSNAILSLIEYPTSNTIKSLDALMPQLECVDLSNNRITWIPQKFFYHLRYLKLLRLNQNHLETFAFVQVPSSLSLDLSLNHKIRSIGSLSEEDVGITHDLYGDIVIFGDPDVQCQSIDKFIESSIDSTPISKVKSSNGQNIQIEDGDSTESCNQQSKFIDSIRFDFMGSKTSANLIKSIAWNASKLVHLSARNNGLADIVLEKNDKIVSLNLRYNQVSELPIDMCKNLTELKSLDLSSNIMKHLLIEEVTLMACAKLVYLDLSWNSIAKVEFKIRESRVNKLTILLLHHNQIEELSRLDGLACLDSLKLLDLRSNQLKSIAKIPPTGLFDLEILSSQSVDPANNDKLQLSFINEDPTALLIQSTSKRTNFGMSINQLTLNGPDHNASIQQQLAESNSHLIKFCTLKPQSLFNVCCTRNLKDENPICFYLWIPSNVKSCLTDLAHHESSIVRSVNASYVTDKVDSNRLAGDGPSRPNDVQQNEDLVLTFIDSLKSSWIRVRESNIIENMNLTYLGESISGDAVFLSINNGRYSIRTSSLIKFLMVVGSMSIIVLLIAMFNLLIRLSSNRHHQVSPMSSKVATNCNNEDLTSSDSCKGTTSNSTSGAVDDSLFSSDGQKSGSDLSSERQTVLERRSSGLVGDGQILDANRMLSSNLNCSTPSSSLAPSSVETAETMQAIDSIQSSTNQFASTQSSHLDSDQYGDVQSVPLQSQQVATVVRMVKSNSANFDHQSQTGAHRNHTYGTLNSRNLGLRQPRFRTIYESTSQQVGAPNELHQNYHYQQLYGSRNNEGSMMMEESDPTLSLMSINTAISSASQHYYRTSASQQVSPATTTSTAAAQDIVQHPHLCQYHRLVGHHNETGGTVLQQQRQEEDQYGLLMAATNLPPPPPPIRAIEALENSLSNREAGQANWTWKKAGQTDG